MILQFYDLVTKKDNVQQSSDSSYCNST